MKSNSFRIILIFFVASLLSILCLTKLHVTLFPKEKGNSLLITFAVVGYSSEQMEQEVTSVLENIFSQLTNVNTITSASSFEHGRIQLSFDSKEDLMLRRLEIISLIRRIKNELPISLKFPTISQQDETSKPELPILVYTFNGPQTPYQLKITAEKIVNDNLNKIEGIKEILVSSTADKQVSIIYNSNKLTSFGLKGEDIKSSISNFISPTYPGTGTNSRNEVAFINTYDANINIEQLNRIVLNQEKRPSSLIRLGDVADIKLEEQLPNSYFRINGNNAVTISVFGIPQVNSLELAEKVKRQFNLLKLSLPSKYSILLNYDDTTFLKKEISKNLERTSIVLIILFLFVFIAYREWRHILTLFLSLLINSCLTIIAIWALDIEIHIYSLAGIAISFGIMIDHSIVMVDYYSQYRNRKIFTAILGATLTTISALLLVYFLPDSQKQNLIDFSLIIVLSLVICLITNLWFTVSIHSLLFGNLKNKRSRATSSLRIIYKIVNFYTSIIKLLAKKRLLFCLSLTLMFGIPIYLFPDTLENQAWYNNTLGSHVYKKEIRPFLDKWVGGTFRLFETNIFNKNNLQDVSETKLYIKGKLSFGNTTQQLNDIFLEMENYIKRFNGIDHYTTTISSAQYALIEIKFKDNYVNTAYPEQLKSYIISKALDWGGIKWTIYGVGRGFNNSDVSETSTFKIKMLGYDYDQLELQSNFLKRELLLNKRVKNVNIDEIIDFKERKYQEYVLNINSNLLKVAGSSSYDVINLLNQAAANNSKSLNITLSDKIFPLVIKNDASEDFSFYNLNHLKDGSHGYQIGDISEVILKSTSGSIIKENRQYLRLVSFEYSGAREFGYKYLQEKINSFSSYLPIGYSVQEDNDGVNSKENSLGYPLILTMLLLCYVICAILFENLFQPFLIIVTVPLSFIGLFTTFYLFDFPFDQGGFASFIMLGGLVVNSGIYIINDYNVLIKKHKGQFKYKLLVKVLINRGKTILLTTLATVCGLIPFLFEGESEVFWFSFSVGTISGLLFSIFVIFFMLPVFLWSNNKT